MQGEQIFLHLKLNGRDAISTLKKKFQLLSVPAYHPLQLLAGLEGASLLL